MEIKKQKEVTYTIKHVTVLFSKGEIVIGWEDDEGNIGSKVIPFGESGDDIPWGFGEDFIEAIIEKAFDLDSCCVYLKKDSKVKGFFNFSTTKSSEPYYHHRP